MSHSEWLGRSDLWGGNPDHFHVIYEAEFRHAP